MEGRLVDERVERMGGWWMRGWSERRMGGEYKD